MNSLLQSSLTLLYVSSSSPWLEKGRNHRFENLKPYEKYTFLNRIILINLFKASYYWKFNQIINRKKMKFCISSWIYKNLFYTPCNSFKGMQLPTNFLLFKSKNSEYNESKLYNINVSWLWRFKSYRFFEINKWIQTIPKNVSIFDILKWTC